MPVAATSSRESVLARDLRVAVLRLARRMRAQRVDTSLSLSQLSALAILDRCGPMTAGELAAVEAVQPPTMTKVLATLVERGLVVREAHPTDRRAMRLVVTTAGRESIEAELTARDAWLTAELARLDPEERALIGRLLPVLDRVGGHENEATA